MTSWEKKTKQEKNLFFSIHILHWVRILVRKKRKRIQFYQCVINDLEEPPDTNPMLNHELELESCDKTHRQEELTGAVGTQTVD